jgi:integrase
MCVDMTRRINDLFRDYEFNRLPLGKQASDDTKRMVVVTMRRVLGKYVTNPDERPLTLFAKQKNGLSLPEHYAKNYSANDVRIARSIFSKGWIRFYEKQGMDVSLFSDWVNMQVACNKVKRFYADERERMAIERVCGALKDTDVELYKAYALAYGLGLRSSEIQRAKYGDFWETAENKVIRIWSPKGVSDGEVDGMGYQDRPCDPAWWNEVMSFKTSDDDLIVQVQEDRITREFPKMLRELCGVDARQPVHRLRKYAGHRIMKAHDDNPYIAKEVLGHSSVELTTRVYVGMPTIKMGVIPQNN